MLQRGVSLVELIIFIMIVSTAAAGILLVMNNVTRSSADPMIRKQALAVAEAMLEEVQLQDLDPALCTGALGPDAPRIAVGCINDYNGYSSTGIREFTLANSVILDGYNITALTVIDLSSIGGGTFGGTAIPAGSGVEITVTVADPAGGTITVTGYRAGR
jgi:MSHA pilin protein MshD